MKTPVAVALITVGGLLVLAPVISSQRQLQRAVSYREVHGDGSELPEEVRPRPFANYEWGCFAAGVTFALVGAFGSLRSRATTA